MFVFGTMKRLIIFVLLFSLSLGLAAFGNPYVGLLAGVVSSAMYTLLIEDPITSVKTWLDIPIRTSKLTILIYGRGGSGKTTFIKSLSSLENLKNDYSSTSTEWSDYFRGAIHHAPTMTKRFKRKYTVPIQVADYKGQAPRQALSLKRSFMAQVNAVLFLVDIVHPDPLNKDTAMADSDLVHWLANDTEDKINDRFIQHVAYVGDAILSVIFGSILAVNRGNLRSVRLVINKVDIVQKLMIHGYLKSSSSMSAEDYVRKKFSPIEKYIRDACVQNHIHDVDVSVVSLTEGTGLRELRKGLVETHFKALNIK